MALQIYTMGCRYWVRYEIRPIFGLSMSPSAMSPLNRNLIRFIANKKLLEAVKGLREKIVGFPT